jgi:LAO/AO transport system kinase
MRAARRLTTRASSSLLWPSTEALSAGVARGERQALAKAITLVESSRSDHQAQGHALLASLQSSLPSSRFDAIRIGITGPPGVGKSTFIEAFGMHAAERGMRLAVLAVDPSSSRSGGSILGDKTRMTELARHPHAYVRPSPSRGTLGGVARATASATILCQAAGCDALLIETVGVGQSETAVASMCDVFLLLAAPGGGDELQGIKKGVMELADIVVVNKADSKDDARQRATRTAAEISSALRLVRAPNAVWHPKTLLCSSVEKSGIDEVWSTVREFERVMKSRGLWAERRLAQKREWFDTLVTEHLVRDFHASPAVQAARARLLLDLEANRVSPGQAADELLAVFEKEDTEKV